MNDNSQKGNMCELARLASQKSVVDIDDSIGAAVIANDRKIYGGRYLRGSTSCSTVHAEFAAIINALTNGCSGITALAVFVSETHKDYSPVPCGACLQAISDYSCVDNIPLYVSNPSLYPHWNEHSLLELLPQPWRR